MKRALFILVLLWFPAHARNANEPAGARAAALGNAYAAQADLWSGFHNQAGLAAVNQWQAGIYHHQAYLIPALSRSAFALAAPALGGTWALSYGRLGNRNYNENRVGLAYARSFGPNLRVGAQINYLGVSIGDVYGSSGRVAAELGVQAKVLPRLWVGAHIYNPTRAKASPDGLERIPTVGRLGIRYEVSTKVVVLAEAQKDVQNAPVARVGIEYLAFQNLFLRGGLEAGGYSNSSFGVGYKMNRISLDFAASHHSKLGFSPQLSLQAAF